MRRMPRPGAVLQREVRRSELRRRERSHGACRDHVHDLPRHHEREQHPRERRLHDRGADALPLRVLEGPAPPVDQQPARPGEAGLPQEDLPEAAPQDGRVLLDLPQGPPPLRAQQVQGVPEGTEPLRHLSPERRLGARGPELLLPGEGEAELRRGLPHAARGLLRPRAQERQDPRPPLPEREHGARRAAGTRRHAEAARGVPPGRAAPDRHLRPARGRHHRREAPRADPPDAARAPAGPDVSPRGRHPDPQDGPPLHGGHRGLERGLGGPRGEVRRQDHRPERRHGRARDSWTPGPTS